MFNPVAGAKKVLAGPDGPTGSPATDLQAFIEADYEPAGHRQTAKHELLKAVLFRDLVEGRCGPQRVEAGEEAIRAFGDPAEAVVSYEELVEISRLTTADLFADPDALEELQGMADLCPEGDNAETLNARFAFLLEEPGSRADELIEGIEAKGGVVIAESEKAFRTNPLGLIGAVVGSIVISWVSLRSPAPDPVRQWLLHSAGILCAPVVLFAAVKGRLGGRGMVARIGLITLGAAAIISLSPALAPGVEAALGGKGIAALFAGGALCLLGGLLLRFRSPLDIERTRGRAALPPVGDPQGSRATTVPREPAASQALKAATGAMEGQADAR